MGRISAAPRGRFVVVLVFALLFATACTSNSDDTTTTEATTDEAAAGAEGDSASPTTSDASGTTTAPAETVTTTTAPSTTTTTTRAPTTTTTLAVPAGNRTPEVFITSPGDLTSLVASLIAGTGKFGSPVTLTATASDADGDLVTVEWYSSLEGYLGTGDSISVVLHTVGSDASQPIITARATDQWGVSAESSIQVIVWIPSDT